MAPKSFKCKKCQSEVVIDVTLPKLTCPQCGQKYNNKYFVSSPNEEVKDEIVAKEQPPEDTVAAEQAVSEDIVQSAEAKPIESVREFTAEEKPVVAEAPVSEEEKPSVEVAVSEEETAVVTGSEAQAEIEGESNEDLTDEVSVADERGAESEEGEISYDAVASETELPNLDEDDNYAATEQTECAETQTSGKSGSSEKEIVAFKVKRTSGVVLLLLSMIYLAGAIVLIYFNGTQAIFDYAHHVLFAIVLITAFAGSVSIANVQLKYADTLPKRVRDAKITVYTFCIIFTLATIGLMCYTVFWDAAAKLLNTLITDMMITKKFDFVQYLKNIFSGEKALAFILSIIGLGYFSYRIDEARKRYGKKI